MSYQLFPQADLDAIATALSALSPERAGWLYDALWSAWAELPVEEPCQPEIAHGALSDLLLMRPGLSSCEESLAEIETFNARPDGPA